VKQKSIASKKHESRKTNRNFQGLKLTIMATITYATPQITTSKSTSMNSQFYVYVSKIFEKPVFICCLEISLLIE